MSNTSKRGFASMDPEKQREIASRGGRAAHAKGTAHRFTPEEARIAGRKGGESSRGGRGASLSNDLSNVANINDVDRIQQSGGSYENSSSRDSAGSFDRVVDRESGYDNGSGERGSF